MKMDENKSFVQILVEILEEEIYEEVVKTLEKEKTYPDKKGGSKSWS